jgi:hypothetical protein
MVVPVINVEEPIGKVVGDARRHPIRFRSKAARSGTWKPGARPWVGAHSSWSAPLPYP